MKWLVVTFLLTVTQTAWPQYKSGTVIFLSLSENQLTVAADSRITFGSGEYQDTECKISAFGSKFIFTMAGVAENGTKWNARSIARQIWQSESKDGSGASDLHIRVSDKWITAMEKVYDDPALIAASRTQTGTDYLASAAFAALDKSGKINVMLVDIGFDLRFFDATGKIRFFADRRILLKQSALGHADVVTEFLSRSSERSIAYMEWFDTTSAALSRSKEQAALASKFIELSILLHPKNTELGFPIDVVQFGPPPLGIHWIWIKPNCQQN
jgi:hypothetical protein